MPEFTVVEKHLSNYQELRKKMSPELQEAFLNACLGANISEDDWIHSLFAFQGELFTGALEAQMKTINTALAGALSARQAENKELAMLLKGNQTASTWIVTTLRQAATANEAAEVAFAEELRRAREEFRSVLEKMQQKAEEQARGVKEAADNVTKKAELLGQISRDMFWWIVGLAFASGILATIGFQHFAYGH